MQKPTGLKLGPVQTNFKLFYGWVIAGVGLVTSFLASLNMQGFSSYLGPLGKEFGWNRTTLAGPRSIVQVEGALLGPIDGFLIDKLGPRIIVTFGLIVLGAGLILFGQVHNLWQYYTVNVMIGLGASFAGVFPIYVSLNQWFRRKRTTAMAVAQLGISFSGLIAVPALVWCQNAFGWRTSAVASGVIVWVIGIPIATLLKKNPESMGLLPDGDVPGQKIEEAPKKGKAQAKGTSAPKVDFTLKEATRTKAFFFIAASNGLNGLVMSAVTVHQFLHMEQGVGISRTTAGGVLSLLAAFNIAGRFVGGYLGDRYTKRQMLMVALSFTVVSLVPFALAKSIWPVLVWAALYGFGWGMRAPIQFSMVGEYFGRTSYGKIQGWINATAVPLGAIGPIFAGAMADWQGNYRLTYLVLCGVAATAALMYLMTAPPKQPVRPAGSTPAPQPPAASGPAH